MSFYSAIALLIASQYVARYSLARLNFSPFNNGENIIKQIQSNFQKKIVSFEFQNILLDHIERSEFDYFIIDLIDDRLGLIEIEQDVYITFSDEIKPFIRKDCKSNKINYDEEAFFSLWKKGVDLLFNELVKLGKLNRVIINNVFWASKTKEGNYIYQDYGKQKRVFEINKLLSKQYEYLAEYTEINFINYPNTIFTANPKHKWGLFAFHYSDDVYNFFLNRLKEIEREQAAIPIYKRWKQEVIFCNKSDFLFELNKYRNGIYSIDLYNKDMRLDVMVRNFSLEALKKSKNIIISLNGAIEKRHEKSVPFFTLTELAQEIGGSVPFLSISDPSLKISQNLNLAWYNGNELIPDLLDRLAKLIDDIAANIRKENLDLSPNIILVGGSGAGYAILQILTKIKTVDQVKSLIWNPQFNLSEYNLNSFKKYIYYCHNSLNSYLDLNKFEIYRVMDELSLDVEVKAPINSNSLLLLNSKDHSHIFSHFKEYFVRNYSLNDLKGEGAIFEFGKVKLIFGEWGQGHAAPVRKDLAHLLYSIINNPEFLDKSIGEIQLAQLPVLTGKYMKGENINFFLNLLNCEIIDNKVSISFPLTDKFSVFNLVYYLMDDKAEKCLNSMWNTRKSILSLEIPTYYSGNLNIRVFIRSAFGEQLIITKKV